MRKSIRLTGALVSALVAVLCAAVPAFGQHSKAAPPSKDPAVAAALASRRAELAASADALHARTAAGSP